MTASLYVYFKVPAGVADEVARRLFALQRRLAAETGVAGRLCRRRDDESTWMEVYEGVADPDGFAAHRDALWRDADLDGFALAPHLEWFAPLAAPRAPDRR
ncbi:uncharacterized protein DUF4936 [Crenobacter luteus]|uniref:DUF4936 family protein n=1 Tax=Crenobacter luteus TaxID=1452487 RepID=UPI0010448E76|nr:DUF4936 family protein [Crenobacter luteus]TCP12577.1 uncharacterized protein DUF4936 [Crenobacter luteus]